MQPCEAAQAPNALRTTSTTLWEVKTLPPTTPASAYGLRRQPSGISTSTGTRQPYFNRKINRYPFVRNKGEKSDKEINELDLVECRVRPSSVDYI